MKQINNLEQFGKAWDEGKILKLRMGEDYFKMSPNKSLTVFEIVEYIGDERLFYIEEIN